MAMWYNAGLALQSQVQIQPVAAVYQHQLSVPSVNKHQRQLTVNGHTTLCSSPHIHGLAASAGVQLKATGKGDQHCPVGP